MIELHPELSRSIFDGLPAGIAVIDVTDCVLWCNTVLVRLLGRDMMDIVGRNVESLPLPLPARDQRSFHKHSCRVAEKGQLISITREMKAANFTGQAMLVIDRESALDWFFDALSTGGFDGSAASRYLSRNALFSRLQLEVSRSRRYANPLSCLVIRIDFGIVEPGDGRRAIHDVIAMTLKDQLRWVDVLGQWSDRALVVILPETEDRAAVSLAEKVAAELQQNLSRQGSSVGINVGASSWCKGDDVERLVRRADITARRQSRSTARTVTF